LIGSPPVANTIGIVDQPHVRDLLHRQIGGLLAFEDPTGIDAALVVGVRKFAAVAHQAGNKEGILANHQSADAQPCQARESLIEVVIATGLQDRELQSEFTGRVLEGRALGGAPIVRMDQQGDGGCRGHHLAQQLQPLRRDLHVQRGHSRDIGHLACPSWQQVRVGSGRPTC
jgi:hypothetical protein